MLAQSLQRIAHVECVSSVEPDDWDKHAERLGGGFFHCHAYGKYESMQSNVEPLFVKALDQDGECVGIAVGSIASSRLWPLASLSRRAILGATPATIDASGEMERTIMLALEKQLKRRGVSHLQVCAYDSPNSASVLPTLSYNLNDRYEFYIDLCRPPDVIWKSLKGSRRTDIRKAEKSRVETKVDNSIAGLRLLDGFHTASMQRRGVKVQTMNTSTESANVMLLNSGRALLMISSCDGTPINGAMFGLFGGKAYYLRSGSSQDGNRRCGPVHLIWTIIELLKSQGFTFLNLGGVMFTSGGPSSDDSLYSFKKDFGATIVMQPAGMKITSRLGASLEAFVYGLKRVAVHSSH